MPCSRQSSDTGTPPSACFKITMIWTSLYRAVFIENLLRYLAEKILLPHPLSFGGDYPMISVNLLMKQILIRFLLRINIVAMT